MRKNYSWYGLAAAVLLAGGVCADTVIYNVHGYTPAADALHRFGSLRFDENGRVVATADGDPWRESDHSRIDGNGRTLLPGLIDAHGHVLGLGQSRLRVELAGSQSLEDALQRVKRYAEAHPDDSWILGRGWNQELWPDKSFPTAAQLDEIVPDRPVWLRRIDGHAAWANTRAIEQAGIGAATRSATGGKILRDADGKATGIFVDLAMDLVEKTIPPPDRARDRQALELAMRELVSLGLTGVHDAGVDSRTLGIYRELAEQQRLPLRIYAMLAGAGDILDEFDAPVVGLGGGRLTIRSVKLYADGALGSRGAALLTPYADEPDNSGLMFHDTPALIAMIARARARGFQVGVHAIGDAANRQTIEAFAAAGARPEERHRIEHAQVLVPLDIGRVAELGLIASMQPTHATSDKNMAEHRLGRERMDGAYAWRRFLDAGVVLAAGSDFPVEEANPFHGFHAAVTRTDRAGEPAGGWYPDQALSRAETLRAFTLDAAYAAHRDGEVGSLEPGKQADFILVDRDPLEVAGRELWRTRVLSTWVSGVEVFRAE